MCAYIEDVAHNITFIHSLSCDPCPRDTGFVKWSNLEIHSVTGNTKSGVILLLCAQSTDFLAQNNGPLCWSTRKNPLWSQDNNRCPGCWGGCSPPWTSYAGPQGVPQCPPSIVHAHAWTCRGSPLWDGWQTPIVPILGTMGRPGWAGKAVRTGKGQGEGRCTWCSRLSILMSSLWTIVRKLDLSHLCFSLKLYFLMFLSQFPSMFPLLTYSQWFFSISADYPRHSRRRRSQNLILLIQDKV